MEGRVAERSVMPPEQKSQGFIGGQKAAPCAAFSLDVFRMSGQEAGELA
jgi:hypothetical protein